jgi:hypothetical protein
MESTDKLVTVGGIGGNVKARVWEGVTEGGVKFTAYVALCQVAFEADNADFERDLREHKRPDAATERAIDARMVL